MTNYEEGNEIKIVFTGPMGAGKTTAINAISDSPTVSTDVDNTDHASYDKDTTTVALDFGQLLLDDGQTVRLYGTPGQSRFEFMWRVLGEGALGVVLLLDASQATAMSDLDAYLNAFEELAKKRLIVIGIGRTEIEGAISVTHIAQRVRMRQLTLPVLSVDVRKHEDVLLLIDVLLSLIETSSNEEISS